ncbi:hypothetical protein MMG03_001566 [Fibrobacter succinogenes]|nr:hypothetical protein [Fibrobacter succinogenes]
MTAARFFTVEGVEGEDFCEFKEVSQTAGTFQVLVEGTFGANNVDVFVEFFAECGDFLESLFEASLVTGHTNVFPHDVTELTMDIVNSAVTLDGKELGNLFCGLLLAVFESRIRFGNLFQLGACEVATDGERNHEVTIGEALHKSRSAETVSTVVREVCFTENEAARDGGHQIVVNPQTTHGVVDCREDAHRNLVRVFVNDLFVHLEEVTILSRNACNAHALDSVCEVQVNCEAGVAYAETGVANLLSVTGSHVTRNEVTEAGVLFFEVVVTIFFRNLVRRTLVASLTGNPNTAIVTERFRHQSQLGLQVSMTGQAGRVNLSVAGVSKCGTLLVSAECSSDVRTLSVGGQVVNVTVTTGAKADCVANVAFKFASHQVTNDNTASLAIDNHEVHHFATRKESYLACCNLAHESLVCTEEELLTGLTASVEGTGNLGTTEGTVVQEATVFTAEGNTLSDALVDDQVGVFGETMNVGFTSAEVTALNGIVEKTIDRVTIVLIALSSIDTTLGSNGVSTTGRVLNAEGLHIVAQFCERSCSGSTSKTGTHHENGELTLVSGVHELQFKLMLGPLFFNGTTRNFRIENH